MEEQLGRPCAVYDAIAEWYDGFVSSPLSDAVCAVLFDLVGDVAGQRVCDLGCGQGTIARGLAKRGARVTGIDLSLRLLELARGYERREPLGVSYLHGDAQHLEAVRDACFEGVTCNLALMDIPDLGRTLQTVARLLGPGGWFVFSIVHPCFQTPRSTWIQREDGTTARVVSGYFDEGFWRSDNPNGVRGKVGAYHRTLSTYLNALASAGLALEKAVEPPEVGTTHPGNHEVPWLFLGWCRGSSPTQPDRLAGMLQPREM